MTNNLISDILFLHTASLKSRCFLFIFIILVFILDFRLVRKLVFLYFNVNVYLKEIPCLNKVTLPYLTLLTPCYPLLPLVTPCYPVPPLVTPCYPCYPMLPLVTPCYPMYTPCYPLLPLVTFVTPSYPMLPLVTS